VCGREECKKDKQVLLDIAAHFKDGGLSRSEGQVAGHVSALRQSGQSEVAELLEGLLRRDRILAAALQAATGGSFTIATPLKLPAPPQVTQVTQVTVKVRQELVLSLLFSYFFIQVEILTHNCGGLGEAVGFVSPQQPRT
jgi:hypothetical protein